MKNIKYLGILMIVLVAHIVYGQDIINYAENGDLEGVQGVDVNAIDNSDRTALMRASEKGHTEIVKLLRKNGTDVNAKGEYGYTALMRASLVGDLEIVNILIEKGADINIRDRDGKTSLMVASELGNLEIAKVLVEAGADVNVANYDGGTALMKASFAMSPYGREHLEVVKLLIEKGADINAKNEDGRTALTIADSEIWRYLVWVKFRPFVFLIILCAILYLFRVKLMKPKRTSSS